MDLWVREARIFKYGSGTGSNFSDIRGEGEPLSGGGKSSGLMSFLRIGDRAAGAIKSGGTTRRAAKMVVLDLDHPDIEDFINWKVVEEHKVAAIVQGSKLLKMHLNAVLKSCAGSAEPNRFHPANMSRGKELLGVGELDSNDDAFDEWYAGAGSQVDGADELLKRAHRYLKRKKGKTGELVRLQQLREEAEKAREAALVAQHEADQQKAEYEEKIATMDREAAEQVALKEWRTGLSANEKVRVTRFDSVGRVVKVDAKKQTVTVSVGLGQWEIPFDEISPAG